MANYRILLRKTTDVHGRDVFEREYDNDDEAIKAARTKLLDVLQYGHGYFVKCMRLHDDGTNLCDTIYYADYDKAMAEHLRD